MKKLFLCLALCACESHTEEIERLSAEVETLEARMDRLKASEQNERAVLFKAICISWKAGYEFGKAEDLGLNGTNCSFQTVSNSYKAALSQ